MSTVKPPGQDAHLLPCGCLPTVANAHRGDCPDWVPINPDDNRREWTWVRRDTKEN